MDKKEKDFRLKMQEAVKEARKKIMTSINDTYGEGTSFLAAKRKNVIVPRISSGSLELDHALGGGYPRGRIVVVWGAKSSNKTTAMKRAIADAQQRDRFTNKYLWEFKEEDRKFFVPMECAWVDLEGTFDFQWAQSIGVDLDNLLYSRPQTHEEGIDVVQSLAQLGFDVAVIDSIAAFAPKDEIECEASKQFMGVAARLNNKMFRKLQAVMNERAKEDHRTVPTLFFINQERNKIGQLFGDTRVKPGGAGQDFYSSVEILFWQGKKEFWDSEKTRKFPKQIDFNFKVLKNKCSAPHIEGKYAMALSDEPNELWKLGDIIEMKEVMDFAKKLEIFSEDGQGAKKTWKMYDKVYKKKKDVMDEWCLNASNFIKLKQDLMKKLFPGHF